MTKIAIIGFGNHIIKNILPAIDRLNFLEIDAIYVRDKSKYLSKSKKYNFELKNIEDSLDKDVKWVYIATPISTHFMLTKRYLKLQKNVICEKPLTNTPSQTIELFEIAKTNDLILCEVSMYKYHKQYKHLEQFINKHKKHIKVVKTSFTIPHLDTTDIRYKKELCGGALLDVGYYPISVILSLFGEPKDIKFNVFGEEGYSVDLFGTAILEYKNFYCIAEWGIGLPYTNEICIINVDESIKYERIFSKPETLDTKAILTKGYNIEDISLGSDDHFVNMFDNIINKLEACDKSTTIQISKILNKIGNKS